MVTVRGTTNRDHYYWGPLRTEYFIMVIIIYRQHAEWITITRTVYYIPPHAAALEDDFDCMGDDNGERVCVRVCVLYASHSRKIKNSHYNQPVSSTR